MSNQNEGQNSKQSKEMDDCLTNMCAWIQDSSSLQSNGNDQMLLSMLENWHPNTLFLDLPTAKGSEVVDAVSNRAFDNALMEFSADSPEDGEVTIAQYISTNIKRKGHNELQRVAMHLEKGHLDGSEVMQEDVEEITKNQAKVMKKNFTYFKDGKPMQVGKIHVVNIGRERQGNTPMKFSLNYLSTNVPHEDGIELKGVDREKALEHYKDRDAFRRKLEEHRNKKTEYNNSAHLRAKSFENIAEIDTQDGHKHEHEHKHDEDAKHDEKSKVKVSHEPPSSQIHQRSFEEFETPIVRHDPPTEKEEKLAKVVAYHERAVDRGDNRDNESVDSFDSAIVHHDPSRNNGGRFHLISTENFKFPHVSTFGNPDNINQNNNGFARAYRYHSKRRSAHLYEWPCPNGSFRMLKND